MAKANTGLRLTPSRSLPLTPSRSLPLILESTPLPFAICPPQVQNVLDTFATALERVQALLTWRDPMASAILLATLLVLAAATWLVGLPVVLAGVVLVDIVPPPFRDPLPSPTLILLRYLPSRSDQMM